MRAPKREELALLADEFGLNPLAVEDAVGERQRPKVDHYDDHLFISLYDVTIDEHTGVIHAHELAVFVAKVPDHGAQDRRTTKSGPSSSDGTTTRSSPSYGVGYLLWGCSTSSSTGTSTPCSSSTTSWRSSRTCCSTPARDGYEVQRRSYELRKSLVQLRRVVVPTREVLNALMRRENDLVDDAMIPYYQDVYDHVLRAADSTDSLRDLVSTILETHLTIQGNRMNEIMKKVTSWAAIGAVPTIITGYYGMNVKTFPRAGSEFGGIVALVLMAGIVDVPVPDVPASGLALAPRQR